MNWRKYVHLRNTLQKEASFCFEVINENEIRREEGLEVNEEWVEENRKEMDMLDNIVVILNDLISLKYVEKGD